MPYDLYERFVTPVHGIVASTVQTSISSATARRISGSSIAVQPKPGPPLTYRINLAGTKTGTNAAHTVTLVLGNTVVMTLTADDTTAVDWTAEFIITWKDHKNQRILGRMQSNGLDCECDYAAGTVDCSNATEMHCAATSHASDTLTCEMVIIDGGGGGGN